MKIAVASIMSGAPWGGSEELWAAAAREALGRGMAVEAHLPAWPTVPERVAELRKRGMAVSLWRPYDPRLTARLTARLRGRPDDLARQLRRSAADVLVLNQGSAFDLAAHPDVCEVLTAAGRPVVLVVQHNHENPVPAGVRARVGAVYERAAAVVFVAERNRRTAERQLARPLPRAVVLQNPVNLGSFEAVPWPRGAAGRMACVARLDVSAKGQDVLIEALAGPAWAGRDWRLSVVGGGPDREYLEALARFYGIAERVDFAGHVRDVAAVWAGHELLVLPSRSEGTPLALVEALVAGRPAVVTDVGGSAAWVADGETGFVAAAATPAAIGAVLERAWERRADWERMGAAAHAAAAGRVDRDPGATLLEAILRCR